METPKRLSVNKKICIVDPQIIIDFYVNKKDRNKAFFCPICLTESITAYGKNTDPNGQTRLDIFCSDCGRMTCAVSKEIDWPRFTDESPMFEQGFNLYE